MVPVGGVVVSSSGYSFRRAGIEAGSVILSVQNIPTPDLKAFEDAITSFPNSMLSIFSLSLSLCLSVCVTRPVVDHLLFVCTTTGKQVSVRYFWLDNKHLERVTVLEIDRHWAECKRRVKDFSTGVWHAIDCAPAPPPEPIQPHTTAFNTRGGPLAAAFAPCFAMVTFDIPYLLDGLHNNKFQGLGLVVDTDRGFVVVDRNTVPCSLGDISITFADSVEIPGEV
jgi:pro-apoptotic serine protease NMA111